MLTIKPATRDTEVSIQDGNADGRATRVPWARHADRLVLAAVDGSVAVVDLRGPGVEIVNGTNLAGEARDTVAFDAVALDGVAPAGVAPAGGPASSLGQRAALLRAAQMLGAMDQALAATREHTAARKQFGRSLNHFQLVGAHLAAMAADATQVEAMLADAIRAHDAGSPMAATAALKLVAGRAATSVARAAHQCHGAIGVTREYRLHQFSRRLWAWRDEFGSERHSAQTLGAAGLLADRNELWVLTEPQLPVAA
jgi:acyl-CoA dehydrogenase